MPASRDGCSQFAFDLFKFTRLVSVSSNCLRVVLFAVALFSSLAPADAHDPGLSTLHLKVLPERIEAELIFARADIETLLKPDSKSDAATIASEALSALVDDRPVSADAPTFLLDETNNVHIAASFRAHGRVLSVTSNLIDRMPRGHRQFVSVRDEKETLLAESLLKTGQETVSVDCGTRAAPATFRSFFSLGVLHILTGYDHLLFLFALLCITPSFRSAALIITSFTVAHSITLGAATMNWVNVESKFIEPLIAVTIVYVGVENLIRRDASRGRWLLTFAFGLIHGFGFASVLRELGVAPETTGIAVPLFSFNLGVETGQITIAALVLPIIFALRKRPIFVRRWVPVFSTIVIALGVFWLVERTLL